MHAGNVAHLLWNQCSSFLSYGTVIAVLSAHSYQISIVLMPLPSFSQLQQPYHARSDCRVSFYAKLCFFMTTVCPALYLLLYTTLHIVPALFTIALASMTIPAGMCTLDCRNSHGAWSYTVLGSYQILCQNNLLAHQGHCRDNQTIPCVDCARVVQARLSLPSCLFCFCTRTSMAWR
jgi:hypothetical protein